MKIYTKTGDQGKTSLIGGSRVLKSHDRIEAYGTIDELNSWLGLLRDTTELAARKDLLKEIQDRLFTIGADLASEPEQTKKKIPDLKSEDIERLETEIDAMQETLPPLMHFVLPGGHRYVSEAHIARTVCRRAERCIVALGGINPLVVQYVNRLSDFLFVLSRAIAFELKAEEIKWTARV